MTVAPSVAPGYDRADWASAFRNVGVELDGVDSQPAAARFRPSWSAPFTALVRAVWSAATTPCRRSRSSICTPASAASGAPPRGAL